MLHPYVCLVLSYEPWVHSDISSFSQCSIFITFYAQGVFIYHKSCELFVAKVQYAHALQI